MVRQTLRLLSFLALFCPAVALAEDAFPRLFSVVGVAADDVLNIRAEPSSDAEIVGALAPDQTAIEGIGQQGGWIRVNTDEGSGFASARFLEPSPDRDLTQMPFRCFGTEPFWAFDRANDFLTLSRPDGQEISVDEAYMLPATGRFGRYAVSGSSILHGLTLFVSRAECSDGMSDRLYGLSADLLMEDGFDAKLYSGCCSIEPPASSR